MTNTPFWIAHSILWVAWLVSKCSNHKVLKYLSDWIVAGCFGAMIMYVIVELI